MKKSRIMQKDKLSLVQDFDSVRPGRSLLLFLCICFMFASACSAIDGMESPSGSSSASGLPLGPEEIVRRTQVQTLQRMMQEEDPRVLLENSGAESSEVLLGAGVVVVDGHSYSVETNRMKWDISVEFDLDYSISDVDSALTFVMVDNDVTWCGDILSGYDFVRDYMDMNSKSFETHEEYNESIADYVNCNDG